MASVFLRLLSLVGLVLGSLGAEFLETELWGGSVPLSKDGVSQRGTTSPMSSKISSVNVPKLLKLNDEGKRLQGKYAQKNLSVLVIPGGGYDFISSFNEGTEVCAYLNSIGISAYMLLYRHHPYRHPVPLLDAFRGLRLVRKLEAEKKDGVGGVGVIGFSAGGHLAASILTFADRDPSVYLGIPGAEDAAEGGPTFTGDDLAEQFSCRPDFSVLVYPVISMEPGVTHDRSRRNIAGSAIGTPLSTPLDRLLSLEKSVLRDEHEFKMRKVSPLIAPVLIIHSGDDQTVPVENALRFYKSLNSLNGHAVNEGTRDSDRIECDVEMRLYSYGNHGFGLHKRGKKRLAPAWNGPSGVFESWMDRKMPFLSSK